MSEPSESNILKGLAPALVVLAFAVLFLAWAYQYGPSARAFPVAVGWTLLALALLDVASHAPTALGRRIGRVFAGGTGFEGRGGAGAERWARRELISVAWMTGFVAAAAVLGFLIAAPLYVFLFMWRQGAQPLLRSAIAACVAAIVVYAGFEVLLEYRIYRGLLFTEWLYL